MDEDDNFKQQPIGAEGDLIHSAHSAGAALPPSQGGPSFSPSEMQVLAGGQSSAAPIVSWARPADRTVPPEASGIDLDAMKKELDASLSSIDTREALEDAKKSLDKVLAPAVEDQQAPIATQSQSPEKPTMVQAGTTFNAEPVKKFREIAVRRVRDRLSGVRRTGRPMSDDTASADPETFKFPTLEELDMSTPLPW